MSGILRVNRGRVFSWTSPAAPRQIQDPHCGLFGRLPGLVDVSTLLLTEAGTWSPVELQGLKAGACAFQREFLGPFGTWSKNESLVPGPDVEGLL